MSNSHFQFKQFTIHQDRCAMKVTTDACLFGAWVSKKVSGQEPGAMRALDIGAGTGLLTLMLAQKTNLSIDAIEIDKDAFDQARENINSALWKDRINIFHANAEEFVFPSGYKIIISNPPFYENELKSANTKKNVAHHDGLALQQLLNIIKKNLSDDGQFYLLLPYKRNEETDRLARSNNLSINQKTLVRQSAKHNYFRIMIAGSHKRAEEKMTTDEISISNNQQQYTKEFIDLLTDYYLYL